LLAAPQRVPLGGGTKLNADRLRSDQEAVDLQALGLGGISDACEGWVRVGATTTLDELRCSGLLPAALRDLARAEQPSTLRTLATVGGLVATAPGESVLLAALLVHNASVEVADPSADSLQITALADLCAASVPLGCLITALTLDVAGSTALAVTGRTPADVPIVAAYGRSSSEAVTLALTGVADHPVLVDPLDPTAGLEPVADFRGSSAYRLHLAATLSARVMSELSGSAGAANPSTGAR